MALGNAGEQRSLTGREKHDREICLLGRRPEARSAAYDIAFFIALLSTGLALGGALAHLFELPNKIDLPREEYFVVQKAYRGWWQLAYLLAFQLVSMLAVSRSALPAGGSDHLLGLHFPRQCRDRE